MKKIVSFLLALFVIGSFAVYAGGGAEQSSGGGAGAVVLQVFHYMTQATKTAGLNDVEAEFSQKNPGVTFENIYYNNGGDYYTQLATALASGQQPQIIMGNPAAYPHVIEGGFAADLSNNAVIKSLGLTKGDLNGVSVGGKVYAFPLDFKAYGVLYNQTIFDKFGLKPPTKYSELLDICKKLYDAGVNPWIHCYSDVVFGDIEIRPYLWYSAYTKGDLNFMGDQMSGKKKIADFLWTKEAVEWWLKRIPREYMRRDAIANDQVKAVDLFLAGEGAMFYTGTWNIGDTIDKGRPNNFKFGFFQAPLDEDPSKTTLCTQADQIFMVNPKAKNHDTAVKFMEYWMTDGGVAWSLKTAMPLITGASDDRLHPAVQELAKIKKSGRVIDIGEFTVPYNNEFQTIWRKALLSLVESQLTGGNLTVDQAIANAQKAFDDAIATNK
jgi:raffinose/stachyose/melibiose transport system substrate-binding protein